MEFVQTYGCVHTHKLPAGSQPAAGAKKERRLKRVQIPQNGNLNPQFALKCELKKFAQQEFRLYCASVEFVQTYGFVHTHKLPAGSQPAAGAKKERRLKAPLFFGAGNGNRTRITSLGSWSFTIRLYLRHFIYFTAKAVVCQPQKQIFLGKVIK